MTADRTIASSLYEEIFDTRPELEVNNHDGKGWVRLREADHGYLLYEVAYGNRANAAALGGQHGLLLANGSCIRFHAPED